MRITSPKFATLLLVALCLLGQQVAMAAESKATVKSVSGTVVSTVGSKPINALVYVNGKSVFANKTTGAFTLVGNPLVPPLSVGQTLTLRVLATGYAPIYKLLTVTSTQLTSGKFSGLKVAMKPVAPGKVLKVTRNFEEGAENGSFVVSGTVKDGTTPVCAVVWANASAMLACQTGAVGKFSLKGKLSSTGKATLKVFPVSSIYQTYVYTTPDTDKDGTANFMDRDDDNDGLEDANDSCPIDPNPACKPAVTPCTVFAGNSPFCAQGTFPTCPVTRQQALKINIGMTYDDVVGLLGCHGSLGGYGCSVAGFCSGGYQWGNLPGVLVTVSVRTNPFTSNVPTVGGVVITEI